MFTKVMKEELIAGLLKIFGNNISMIILYGSVARNEYTCLLYTSPSPRDS